MNKVEAMYLVRFLMVGVLNTCVGLGTIYACKYFLAIDDIPANLIGYAVGLINSFYWNRRWTFGHTGKVHATVFRFCLVVLIAYGVNLAIAVLLIRDLHVNSYVAHALATIPYTAITFIGSRYYVFRVPTRTAGARD